MFENIYITPFFGGVWYGEVEVALNNTKPEMPKTWN